MFKPLNKQGVESDRGFIVQWKGRFTIEYREGKNSIDVYAEPGRTAEGQLCVFVGRGAFKHWDGQSPQTIIPLEKQQEMLANFSDAMRYFNFSVVVDKAQDGNY